MIKQPMEHSSPTTLEGFARKDAPKGDALGDRMKAYERAEDRRALPMLPVIVRIDGKCFHSFCQGLEKPFDEGLSVLMISTTRHLVEQTGALIGFTQSDEISLLLYSDNAKSQIFFDGRIQKLVSVIASMTTLFFNSNASRYIPDPSAALFDCRAWTVPTKDEAVNAFIWREQDATKNSISMAASTLYSHKQLMGKSGPEKQEMLFAKGVNWNDYQDRFKRGTYVQRRKIIRAFSSTEIDLLPEKHEARTNSDLQIERSEVAVLAMPPLARVFNRVDVLFNGGIPHSGEAAGSKETE